MIDLIAVLCVHVLLNALVILLGSTFNSRQFAIHSVINGVLVILLQTLTCIHLHSKFNKLRKKEKQTSARGNRVSPGDVLPKGMSLPSGLSVVEQSDI